MKLGQTIYLCRLKYSEASYDNEGFRNEDDKEHDVTRLVLAENREEALQKLADKLDLRIWFGVHYYGREHAQQVHNIDISEMIE